MRKIKNFVHKKNTLLVRILAVILPVVILVLLMTQTVFARNTFVITDGSRVKVHSTYATDPAVALNEAGFELGQNDTYTTQEGAGVTEVTVRRSQTILVDNCGQLIQAGSNGETVGDLLSRLNVAVNEGTAVSASLEDLTYDGMEITLRRATTTEETYTAAIPYAVTYVTDGSMEPGEEAIVTEGVNGEMTVTAKVSYADGVEVSRQILNQTVTVEPVNQVIAVGAAVPTEPEETEAPEATQPAPTQPAPTQPEEAPETAEPGAAQPEATEPEIVPVFGDGQPIIGDGTITLSTGEVLTYTDYVCVMGTAYTCEGWSSPGITATGTIARVGEIAVDPDIIPLGSLQYIWFVITINVSFAEDVQQFVQKFRVLVLSVLTNVDLLHISVLHLIWDLARQAV